MADLALIKKLREETRLKHIEDISSLETLCEMKVDEIIFDSQIDDWNLNTSVFGETIFERSKFVIMIYDTNGNVFGAYINTKIYKMNGFISDPNAFLFSLKSNERLETPMKFPIKKSDDAILIYSESTSWLFSVGADDGTAGWDDISIMKGDCQNKKPGNGCVQQSYNYHGIENALCGENKFSIQKIFVIQMK